MCSLTCLSEWQVPKVQLQCVKEWCLGWTLHVNSSPLENLETWDRLCFPNLTVFVIYFCSVFILIEKDQSGSLWLTFHIGWVCEACDVCHNYVKQVEELH